MKKAYAVILALLLSMSLAAPTMSLAAAGDDLSTSTEMTQPKAKKKAKKAKKTKKAKKSKKAKKAKKAKKPAQM
ncbi:MAG: hypothetical protein V1806_09935 [Pseudomonadota bacterium]